jgi:hypothetical protein
MTKIIDTNCEVTARVAQLKALGIASVIRYINPLGTAGEKTVKTPEAHACAAGGLRLGLVCEGWGDFAHGGISAGAGERDGAFCRDYAADVVGAPQSATIYFAVDTDADRSQITKLVLPYFSAIRRQVGDRFRVGVYGSGAVCAAVLSAGTADDAWLSCSMGWSESRAFAAGNKWTLLQHLPQRVAGLDTDPNDVNPDGRPIGDFVPFSAAPPSPQA